ncbi:MAG: hypothetical protein MJE63_06970 [Proteobacteria bacterium]|nr:hypothetical protein [Pseudomonadota bacterium]
MFFVILSSQQVIAENNKLEINAGFYTNFIGSLIMVGAEYPVAEKLAIYARAGNYGYSYSDFDDYEEDGTGTYFGAGVSIYPIEGHEKLRIAVGLEQISGTSEWEDGYTTEEVEISGTSPAVTIGYKWAFDDGFVIEPNVLYVNIPSGELKNSVIVALGVLFGTRF